MTNDETRVQRIPGLFNSCGGDVVIFEIKRLTECFRRNDNVLTDDCNTWARELI